MRGFGPPSKKRHTFDESLSGLIPGVSVFWGEDAHRVFGGVRSSSQDAVELPHYVTTWGHSQTTLRGLVEYIQLEELEGKRMVSVIQKISVCVFFQNDGCFTEWNKSEQSPALNALCIVHTITLVQLCTKPIVFSDFESKLNHCIVACAYNVTHHAWQCNLWELAMYKFLQSN